MTQPWLRLYRGTVNNPKLQRLGLDTVGFWTNCLCLSDDEGYLPSVADIAWTMRVTETATETFLATLQRNNLIIREDDGRLRLHDWDDHQKRSDTSTDRVRKFREKRQKQSETRDETPGNVSETAQSRTDTEKNREDKRESDAREKVSPQLKSRTNWPPEAVVPKNWITIAAQQRRLAGLPEIDLEVAARMFANHYAADTQNPRTMTEFQAKWNNWALKEKPTNGSRTGAKSQLEQLADIVRSGQVING